MQRRIVLELSQSDRPKHNSCKFRACTHTETHGHITPTQQLCVEAHEQASIIQNNRLNRTE